MLEPIKIYLQTPAWFIRPRNTDWRYTRYTIPRLGEFLTDCTFHSAQSRTILLHANWKYARRVLYRKGRLPFSESHGSLLDRREFSLNHCDLVFCHDDFPKNAGSIPVVWQNSILDPEMQRARGASEEDLKAEVEIKKDGFKRAAAVQVSSEAERVRLGKAFPTLAHKFVPIPFFLPNLRPIEPDQMAIKLAPKDRLQCLFVGNEARRKGLDRVYSAFQGLPEEVRNRFQLTVVSAQTDGAVDQPRISNLQVFPALSFERVQELLRGSDILLMPSYFESYGLIFLEAMAQASIPIVPNWEVQREIVGYGDAGVTTSGEPNELAQVLVKLLGDNDLRIKLAVNAKSRFDQCYAPAVVANQFRQLFRQALAK